MAERERTYVVMRGGLGDIVLAQKALHELRGKPGAGELCIATESKYADLFLAGGTADSLLLISGPRDAKRLRRELQAAGETVYNLDHPFSGQRHRRDSLHITERIDEILGTSCGNSPPILSIPPASLGSPHAVLTWASSAEGKIPPASVRAEIWRHFREACLTSGLRPVSISSPTDGTEDGDRVSGSLLQLCAVVRGASLYVGCDTGFSHVAASGSVASVVCHIGHTLARCGVNNENADILYYRENSVVDSADVGRRIDTALGH